MSEYMTDKPKVCPLLGSGPLEIDATCIEGRCAWFHIEYDPEEGGSATGRCALLVIAKALREGPATPKEAAQ